MNSLARSSRSRSIDPWKDFFGMDFFNSGFPASRNNMPAVNLSEDESNYCVDLVAPGFKKEDFKVSINDDILTINAESKEEKKEEGKEYSRREYTSSSFTRSFKLPENTNDEQISANYKDGILKVNIPKSEKEKKASKQIDIQ